ncbi:HEAT repeat-containing protein 1 isoform X1 [Hippoglossus hippoglossus]|uniref:HEAT repeat-containing protein 1 isoform X1 n=1 Tax=Hippoglossus hippoglossus TaxID=8267 RepID=UPI00148BDB18|nr:HEAT repeat-containing protein 1 isoform X1 [Hippoglossus hippoglossus]XP_034426315.1 HEAT repeat-containing protein 1 isoform X1 [Hippoglossus hippoglossus]XP_034426316.1 HEAT repeat-containing protein 1 isoform X1 [Hippoglossus hippoglossus]XP_034426317.1 HEAT repeat-containing protein 1 isoform X1 [Hippoglossus hippoglossus]
MTSLAHQLKRLALPQSDPALLTRKEVASLLFDPKDAASMDKNNFYALGCTGLEELLGIEPVFLEFQDTLFSRASLTLERSVQSKEVNEKLDAGISLFLTRLSPYFLLKPAHKCIEWLVHRFHVHLYNADSLLACALPYHDTNVFVRVLQLLRITDATNRWNWLHCLQKPGVPLSRGALITHCYTDLSFMDFICSMVTKSIQAYSGHSGSCSQLRVIFSFYASTIVPTLDAVDKVSDTIISKLLPYVQRGLKSPLSDYKAASYMIVCQLAVKVVMEASLVDSLAVHISKSLVKEPVLAKEGLGCLIVLLQNQKEGAAGPRAFTCLCSMPSLAPTLQVMAAVHDVSPLLCQLLPHLIHHVFSSSSGEAETDKLSVLESVLKSVPLTRGLGQTVARLLLDEYLTQTELSAENLCALDQRLLPLVRLFESRYCGALDGVLAGHVTDLSSPEQKHLFHQFLSLSLSSGKYQILGDSDTSLLLSLKHPLPSVRVSAVEHLMSIITSGQQKSLDEDFLKDAVIDRVKDDVPEVVAAALKVLEVLFDVLDPEETLSCLMSLMVRVDLCVSEHWLPVLTEAVRLLSDPRLGKGDVERLQRTGWRLLPFLVVTGARPDSAQLSLASYVARSSILAQHPLTFNWAEEMDEATKRSSEHGFVGLVNQRLVSTLTKNLANMEHFSKRDALEKLVSLVEQQWSSGVRERTSFLVLTRTLLLCLGELSETQHLLTAQRVFTLLEPPLLELIAGDDDVQDVGRPVSVPSSFSEALTLYLSSCEQRPGERLVAEFGFVLFSLLRDFISTLKCDDASFKGEVWWNPEKMDTNTCCYLGLICRLFSVVISGAGDGPTAGSFREMMKLLVQVHVREPLMLFRFLCMVWGYGSNHGDQLDVKVGAVLQTRALYMGRAVLSVQPATVLQELAAPNSPVVPSLLCCLTSPVREVRRVALGALQSLSGADSPFQPITEKLLKTSEEIVADPAYLSLALCVFHDDSLSCNVKTLQRKLQASMQQLLQSVQTPCCPSYSAAVLLRALSHVNGQPVLSTLLPVLDRLLEQSGPDTPTLLRDEAQLIQLILGKYNEASAAMLPEDQNCLDLFIRALKTSNQPHPDIASCQISALEQITKSFFSALGEEKVQQKLLTVIFDVLLESKSPLVANTVSSIFKGLAVDSQLIANELSPPEKPRVSVTVQQTRRSKMSLRKPQESSEGCPEGGAVPWQRVTLILELLQHKKKLKRAQTLVPVLFSLLSRSLEPCSGGHANMEYTKQLLLSCLLNVSHKLSPDGRPLGPDVLEEDKFSVELVVQCIRSSDMPQTHHHALLLLGTAATIFPEKVLHNIMPIFTFMGANIMRLDDAYSFRVIDKTVQMVIPALIKAHQLSDDQSSAHVHAVVTRIMHVFADALPHVPDHRRLPVLVQLITTLGPRRFLWVLMLLLFKLHAEQTASSVSEKEASLDRDVDFWISLCCQFEVSEQLASLINILNFLQQLPNDKDDAPVKRRGAKKPEEDEEKVEELIFSVDTHSSKELRHFKFLCVSFMAQLLGSSSFVGKVAEGGDVVGESLQQLQQRLLEENLRFIHSVARCVEENADKPTAKFWRVLLNKTYDVLDKVNALLPTDTFIAVMRGLMGNQLVSVRRKAMELLNNKLQHRTRWDVQQVDMFLQLIGDLLSIVGKSHSKVEEEAEHGINRQTALYSLKLLCRTFGSNHQEAFVPVLQQTVEIVASTEEEKNVMGSALLCIAEVVSTLKARAIPQLPRLMPAVLHTLANRKELLTNEIYLLSAVTALQRVTETLPHFISPYLQDITSQVCRLTRLVDASSSSSSSSVQLSVRLSSLRTILATQLPPRVLLPNLSSCYSYMVVDKKAQLGALLSILKEHITHMEKDQLSSHQSELTTFFLTALDFRNQHCQGDLEKTSEIEGCVIDCLIAMVMKLSEVTFRPLFFKLFDWSKSDSEERLLTFYRLCDAIAERLKGLFVLFAGNLVKPFSDLLRKTNRSQKDEPLFDSDGGGVKNHLLLQHVLGCLQKIFLYDTQRFLSKERADALMKPLVDQLENTAGGQQQYQQMMTQHLVPCVGHFSVALADDSQWKTLNYQILLKTRHSDAKVRFSSLLVLLELTSKLKENYMVLLPETIPFLAELMEDECEEVEQQVQKVVQEMENILGEPLQSYF